MNIRDRVLPLCICALGVAIIVSPAFAGNNPNFKVAVHVVPHNAKQTCASLPVISTCADITTSGGCGDLDIFPVFFNMTEYETVEYGLTWPGSHSCQFTLCSDMSLGTITWPGDGVSQAWADCQPGPTLIPGFGWIYADVPGKVRVIPHPYSGQIVAGDCTFGGADSTVISYRAGVCGDSGDDPCGTVLIPLILNMNDNLGGSCAQPESEVNYTLSYENPNTAVAEGVVVVDSIPPEADYISSSPAGVYDAPSHTVTWNIGTVPALASGSVDLVARVRSDAPQDELMYNKGWVVCDETWAVHTYVYARICRVYEPLSISITDNLEGGCVDPGDEFAYTISFSNPGNWDLNNVTVYHYLATDVTYVSSTGGIYEVYEHYIRWGVPLPAGAEDSLNVTVAMKATTPPGTSVGSLCRIWNQNTGEETASTSTDVCGEPVEPFPFKVAVHVLNRYEEPPWCHDSTASVACEDINTTEETGDDVWVIPVFYGLDDYIGVEYGLAWDNDYSDMITLYPCSDDFIGDFHVYNGQGLSHIWYHCQPGPACIPAVGDLDVDAPTRICVVNHYVSNAIFVVSCDSLRGAPEYNACAGIYGALGDDPCEPQVNVEPTTWGKIKAIFR